MKMDTALNYIIEYRKYNKEALAMKLRIKPENQHKYKKVVNYNKRGKNKSVISNYCNRIRKLLIEDYIEIIESELRVDREYWLDINEKTKNGEKNKKKGFVKILTPEVKQEIDKFFLKEKEETDNALYQKLQFHPLDVELLGTESRMRKDVLMDITEKCAFTLIDNEGNSWDNEYALCLQIERINTLIHLMTELKQIKTQDIKRIINKLKKDKSKELETEPVQEARAMTQEEYENWLEKLLRENTPE